MWKYEGVVKNAVHAIKYRYATEIVQEICGYFVPELKKVGAQNLVTGNSHMVPIPIYWHRENVRGFNQSEEIGKIVAKEMGWKFVPDLLIKNKSTKSQVELSVKARKENLRGVFSLNPIYKSSVLNLRSVILFDDVFTTGSTLKEAAKILKSNGVERVWGMTIAR
ncbi:MAG: ComF family protein [Candidatus Woesebacteria bacterium]|nr:MAG: ComF family protein [Candidatus Woesebacteria bacterium]